MGDSALVRYTAQICTFHSSQSVHYSSKTGWWITSLKLTLNTIYELPQYATLTDTMLHIKSARQIT